MALAALIEVFKGYGAQQVLSSVTFSVGEGEKVALVGPNGCGKSTALKLLVGLERPDSGRVSVLPGTRVGYLPQEAECDHEGTVLDAAIDAVSEAHRLEQELRQLEQAMQDASEDELAELTALYGERMARFEDLGGRDLEARAKAVLGGLGLRGDDLHRPARLLSGGQRTRLCLARALLLEPDLLCLDEPTNHLDLDACEWLEEYLCSWGGTVVLVSHDRYLLDRVVHKVVDLEGGSAQAYRGNYTTFAVQKAERLRQQREAYERQQEEIERLEAYIRRYRAGNRATMAKSREKALRRMVRVQRPDEPPPVRFQVLPASSSGRVVVSLQGAGKRYGDLRLFDGLNLTVERGEKVAVVGPNGSGKSTLLRVIAGEEELTEGCVLLGHNVNVGYLRQQQAEVGGAGSVLDEVLETGLLDASEARSVLARFLFRGDDVFKPVDALSGGERVRLCLAKLFAASPNLLLLDEPTNHLDVPARQALGEALAVYTGAVILVSHDRYLLRKLATRVVHMSPGGVTQFAGGWEDFRLRMKPEPAMAPRNRSRPTAAAPRGTKDLTRERLDQLENTITRHEMRLRELTNILASPETYTMGNVGGIVREYEDLRRELDSLYSQWESMMEHMES